MYCVCVGGSCWRADPQDSCLRREKKIAHAIRLMIVNRKCSVTKTRPAWTAESVQMQLVNALRELEM